MENREMNDRELLLQRQADARRGPQPLPPTPQQVEASILWKAQCVRLYFETLIRVGFSKEEALQLTATAEL